ncbi:hypothetical protein COCNU_scaffold000703G000060 [Cocos nucifera]|nr:hypothetical protein [Cocos nucifera]
MPLEGTRDHRTAIKLNGKPKEDPGREKEEEGEKTVGGLLRAGKAATPLSSTVLGHHLFDNIKAVNLHEAEALKAAKEAEESKAKVESSICKYCHQAQTWTKAMPLPQAVPLRIHMKAMEKEVCQVNKELKKTKDELQKSRNNYATTSVEINRLRQASKQAFKEYTSKKYHLSEELEQASKCASEKSWTLTTKICSLEVELREAREKIQQLEKGSLCTDNQEYNWIGLDSNFSLAFIFTSASTLVS